MSTAKERVLDRLEDQYPEWIDGYVLCHPNIGGSEGLRRLRELRAEGHKIEKRLKSSDTKTRVYQYRLVQGCTCEWYDANYSSKKFLVHRDPDCPQAPHPSIMPKEQNDE